MRILSVLIALLAIGALAGFCCLMAVVPYGPLIVLGLCLLGLTIPVSLMVYDWLGRRSQ